jgi:hypothetical protein
MASYLMPIDLPIYPRIYRKRITANAGFLELAIEMKLRVKN